MSPELVIAAIRIVLAGIKYGNQLDNANAYKKIQETPLVLPVASAWNIVDIIEDDLKDRLRNFENNTTDAILGSQARTLRHKANFKTSEGVAFLIIADRKLLPENLIRNPGDVPKDDIDSLFLLKVSNQMPSLAPKIVVITAEFLATAAVSAAPFMIGQEGVQKLVTGILERFLESDTDATTLTEVSKDLSRRAFNATMDAFATDAGGLRGRSDLIDFSLGLVKSLKGQMGDEKDWIRHARTFLDEGGFVRFVGVLGTATGGYAAAKQSEDVEKLVTELTVSIFKPFHGYNESSKEFLRNHWNELISGALTTIAANTDALEQKEWIKLVVKASSTALADITKTRNFDGATLSRILVAKLSAAFVANPEVIQAGIKEDGLVKLITAVLTPLAAADTTPAAALKTELGTVLVAGLIDLAASDPELRGKILDGTAGEWVGELATQFQTLADNEKLKGLFSEEGRKQLGFSLLNASLKTIAARKADLIDATGNPWLKVVIDSMAEAAGDSDFETLITKNGMRSFLAAAVATAEKNPSLLTLAGNDISPVLPVILDAVRTGLKDRDPAIPPGQDLAALLVESFGAWIGSRKEIQSLQLETFITSLTESLATAVKSGKPIQAALLSDIVTTAVQGLVSRTDTNHLVKPETIAIALAWLFQKDLSAEDLLFAVGRVSSHLLQVLPPEGIQSLFDYDSEEWAELLRKNLDDAISKLPATGTDVNLRTALLIASIDQAIASIGRAVSSETSTLLSNK